MECPTCGSPMRSHTTTKNVLFMVCGRYPKCPVSGTPELVNLLVSLRTENQRLCVSLDESRQSLIAMADKYADARDGKPREHLGSPVRIGEYIEQVAQIAVERSRRNQKRKQ